MSSYELQNELSDEKRFVKTINPSLEEVRNAAGDGLFTVRLRYQCLERLSMLIMSSRQAYPHEQNWAIARMDFLPRHGL